MQQNHLRSTKPTKYAKISLEKRIKLASMVLDNSISIAKSAIKVGIKLSTAKLIMKKYKEEGSFFESRKDRMDRLQNRETQLEAALEHQISHGWNDQTQAKTCMQAMQPCFYVDFTSGMVYFQQPSPTFLPCLPFTQ